jgi:hypothetical protein
MSELIDATPQKIMLAMPCMDGRIWVETMMGVMAVLAPAQGAIQPYWHVGDSNIAHCRNGIAHYFLTRTDFDTLFFLDSDIVFTAEDFAYLLEGKEQVVIAPYARKIMGSPPTGFGMGFCRIHRSVFDTLNGLLDDEGGEALGRYYIEGQGVATHFFYTGASTDARWFGEDTGFWHFCAMNNITTRFETRTKLGHIGFYKYGCPNQLPAGVVPYAGPRPYDLPPPPVVDAQPAENFAGGEF